MTTEVLLRDPATNENDTIVDYKKYADHNLSVFPVHLLNGQIIPPQNHQKYGNNVPSKVEIDAWSQHGRNAQAFGMAMGKTYDAENRLVCLDVDHDGLVAVIEYLFPTPCARFGSKGKGFFYRVDRDDKELKKSVNLMIPGRKSPAIEFLSMGRFTFIPPSVHRKTGDRYRWVGAPILTALNQLPVLTSKDLRIIQTIVGLDVDGATVENLLAGEGTHYATLSLCGALVARGLDRERVVRAVELLFPKDYKGDTTRQISEMVDSAFRKGFDKKQIKISDGDIEDEDLSDLFADWHYVTSINRMVNSTTKDKLDRERFDATFGTHVRRAWAVYCQWQGNSIKQSLTYLPGKPAIMEEEINMWRPSDLNPKPGDVSTWLDHLKHFYDEQDVDHVLDWLAHVVQKPDIKPGHAIIMGSAFEGIGKDLWLFPIRSTFGEHNVSEIGADSLSSQFNEWLAHKHLVILQEMWTGSRRELSNQLKTVLASPPDTIWVNEKGISRYEIPNICAVIMLTNHKDAISIAAEDRRYFVMWSDKSPRDSDYYEEFANWVADPENQSRVYHYLKHRDVSNFNIKARPPKTSAKTVMVEATMTRSENLIAVVKDYMVENDVVDVVYIPSIEKSLRHDKPRIADRVEEFSVSSSNHPVRVALKELGYEPKHIAIYDTKKTFNRVVYIRTNNKDAYEGWKASELFKLANNPFDWVDF